MWVRAPNDEPEGNPRASTARHHGDFDDDKPTLLGLLGNITGVQVPPNALVMRPSTVTTREIRRRLDGPAIGV